MTKKILAVLASTDFRDEEFNTPNNYWKAEGADVMTMSSVKNSFGRFGTEVKNDFVLGKNENEIEVGEFDAIFFVGGGGCLDFMENKLIKNIAQEFVNTNKIIGSICAAPRLLLHWNILKGKKMTGWNGDKKLQGLSLTGKAIYTGDPVTIDGEYITADGPDSAEEFAEALWTMLN